MTANAIKAGLAYVEVGIRSKVQAGLNKISGRVQALGGSLTQVGAGVVGFGAAAAGAFVAPIKAAAEAQATMGKFETVFGQQTQAVKAWGDELAGQVGRGKTEVAGFLAANQDLFVPLGFDQDTAVALSKQVTSLGIDLASFNDKVDADTLNDLQAALTGSGEVMKKYGVILSEATVKQDLLNKGIDPKNASDQQKVLSRLSIILEGTTAAQGDAARTAGEFNNTWKRLTGVFTDAAEQLGGALIPAATELVGLVADNVTIAAEWISKNQDLVVMVAKGVAIFTAAGVAIVGLGLAVSAVGVGLSGLASVAGAAATAVGLAGSVIAALVSPVGLVIAAIVALGVYWAATTDALSVGLSQATQVFNQLKDTALAAFGGIKDALAAGDIQAAAGILWKALELTWEQGTESIRNQFARVVVDMQNIWNGAQLAMGKAAIRFAQEVIDAWDHVHSYMTLGFGPGVRESIEGLLDLDVDELANETERELSRMLNQQVAAREKAASAAKKERAERIAALKQELAALNQQAAARRKAKEDAMAAAEAVDNVSPEEDPFDINKILAGLEGVQGKGAGVKGFGTFSARAAEQFGYGGKSFERVQTNQLDELKGIRKGIDRIASKDAPAYG